MDLPPLPPIKIFCDPRDQGMLSLVCHAGWKAVPGHDIPGTTSYVSIEVHVFRSKYEAELFRTGLHAVGGIASFIDALGPWFAIVIGRDTGHKHPDILIGDRRDHLIRGLAEHLVSMSAHERLAFLEELHAAGVFP